jgi:hypothetical protein
MLVALLMDMPLGPPAAVDVSNVGTLDKLFMLATCCSEMIVEVVWAQTGEQVEALRGLDTLFADIRDRVRRRSDDRSDDVDAAMDARRH